MFKKLSKLIHSEKGEMYISDSVKIVIAVVVGSALLAGLVGIFNKVILPATRNWFEDMFTATDKYSGSIEDIAFDYNNKPNMILVLNATESTFYNKYKDDPDVGGEICGAYTTILYGGTYYGIDRDTLEKDVRENLAGDSMSPKEKQFCQDWLYEFDEADDKMRSGRADACASEITHYYAKCDRGKMTEEEARDKVAASAERHGYDSELVLSMMFG